MYDAVYIPAAVQDEFLAVARERRQQSLAHSPWIQVAHLHTPGCALTFSDLDSGEAEVLALAVERSARLVIIDERKGRRYAKRLLHPELVERTLQAAGETMQR
jgi:predicted nucleic acid-binding protein